MPLSASILSALQNQYQHERKNEHNYLVRASIADFYGLSGISCFLRKQSDGERDHAMQVYGYIAERNQTIAYNQNLFAAMPESSMIEMLKGVLKIEQETTATLQSLYVLANSEGDFLTASWVLTGLLKEQIEEENIIQSIIDRYNSRLNINTLTGEENVTMASEVGAALHDLDVYVKENFCG